MKVIGITGGIGAGKTSVCAELNKYGAEIIDADKIARQVVQKNMPAYNEIITNFGGSVLKADGELDRKKLAEIVFSDDEKLNLLNRITHKYILKEMELCLESSKAETVVLDVPLLFQCEFSIKCDLTIAVTADKETRINRIVKRDGITRADAEKRISKQLSNEEYSKFADICFENNGEIKEIEEFVKKINLI